jgi:hypothetical protein
MGKTHGKKGLGIRRADWVLWCLAGAVALILWFLPDRTTAITAGGLLALGLLLIFPAFHLPIIRNARPGLSRMLSQGMAFASISAALIIFGAYVWPFPGLAELTSKQRRSFQSRLKTQSKPILVHLMCAPNDERDCIAATQFISLFEQVGWHVKGKMVDRIYNGTPHQGLYFVLHSTADRDPSWPDDVGVWTKMQPDYYIVKSAFDELQIKNDLVVGASFPEDELGIYFGVGTAKP